MWTLLTSRSSIFLAIIIAVCIAYLTGLNKGASNERNSIQNKQKTTLIAQQKSIINQQIESIKLRDKQLSGFSEQLKSQKESYTQIQRELDNEKDSLDKSNKLTAKFVRLYNSAIRANGLHTTDIATNAVITESDTVRASTALTIMNKNTERCNGYITQLNTLIDYIYSQYDINMKTYNLSN